MVLDDDPRLLHSVQAIADFGHAAGGETDQATVTVAAPWVSSTSVIVCTPAAVANADHDPQDAMFEQIVAYPSNLVVGVGFDIVAYAPHDTWGRYLINARG